jgi:hypothetical protein
MQELVLAGLEQFGQEQCRWTELELEKPSLSIFQQGFVVQWLALFSIHHADEQWGQNPL